MRAAKTHICYDKDKEQNQKALVLRMSGLLRKSMTQEIYRAIEYLDKDQHRRVTILGQKGKSYLRETLNRDATNTKISTHNNWYIVDNIMWRS